jgi:hypothetical protein
MKTPLNLCPGISQQQEKCSNHTYLYKTTKHVISIEGRSGEMACSE